MYGALPARNQNQNQIKVSASNQQTRDKNWAAQVWQSQLLCKILFAHFPMFSWKMSTYDSSQRTKDGSWGVKIYVRRATEFMIFIFGIKTITWIVPRFMCTLPCPSFTQIEPQYIPEYGHNWLNSWQWQTAYFVERTYYSTKVKSNTRLLCMLPRDAEMKMLLCRET